MKSKLIGLIFFLLASTAFCISEREASFSNGPVTLNGTLLLPETGGKHPAIVFLHGSGTATRAFARPFAEKFAEIGMVSLIFDKRGSGTSTGSWIKSSLDDLSNDAIAALEFVKVQPEVDPKRVGLYAVSQSGWVAPVAMSHSTDVSFLIVVTGGGASPLETELYGYRTKFKAAGLSDSDQAEAMTLINQYFDYLRTGANRDKLVEAIDKSRSKSWYSLVQLDRILPTDDMVADWKWVPTFDPLPSIEKIRCPVLLFFGGKDPFQPAREAEQAWKSALAKGGNRDVTDVFLPEAGHAMTMGEHHAEHPVLADGYMDTMIQWLQSKVLDPALVPK